MLEKNVSFLFLFHFFLLRPLSRFLPRSRSLFFLVRPFFFIFSGLAKGTEKHKNHAWDPTLHLCTCGEQALIKVDAMSGLVLLVRPLDHSTESIALFMGKQSGLLVNTFALFYKHSRLTELFSLFPCFIF